MAKIVRATQTIFGGTGINSDFGEFGSLAAGTPTTTKNPATIQSLPAWLLGWAYATIGSFIPAYQDMNSVHYLAFYQICYLLQMGIAEYDAATTYYINSICQYNGLEYQSLVDTNIGNEPDISPTQWICISTTAYGGTVASATSITLPNIGNSFKISGSTTISSITIKPAGIIINLIFTGSLTVTTGGNILLNSGNFNTSADYTLVLISDGTNWFELSRNPTGFGAWGPSSTYSLNQPYQAPTDGFVSAWISGINGAGLQGITDSSPSPTTVRQYIFYDVTPASGVSILLPVRKGDYFQVNSIGTINQSTIYFLPLGN